MANTYTQIHIQAIFAVQNRKCLIHEDWEKELHKYITGIVQNYDHKVLCINSMPDHVHVFFGMRPTQSISDLMKMVKGYSSKWVNEKGFLKQRFSWQEGYGAFSYSKSQVPTIIKYVQNQKEHHKKKTFIDEYRDLLIEFELTPEERYIFNSVP